MVGKVVLTGLVFGMLGLSRIGSATPFWTVEPMLFLNALCMGATMMPSMSAAMSTWQRHQVARATSGLNVVQRVGSSIGTALLAIILNKQISWIAPVAQGGLGAVRGLAPSMQAKLTPALNQVFGHTFLWSFGIIILAIGAALFLPRSKSVATADESSVLSALE